MSFSKTDFDTTCYKPKMHQAKSLSEIPFSFNARSNLTIQVKADGEFNWVKYQREGETYAVNRFGRKTTDLPCLKEFAEQLAKWNVVECEVLAELYAVDKNNNPLTLPNFIHFLKGEDKSLHNQVKIGLFDLLSVNGVKSELIYSMKYSNMMQWCEGGNLVHVLPWSEPTKLESVQNFWKEKVDHEKWEGLVIRQNNDIWKLKPNCDVDAVILGLNKNNKGWDEGMARSVKLALMTDEGNFVEIGDCSGVGEEEAMELRKLEEFKVSEDRTTVWVQPIVIVTVEYIATYPDTKNRVFSINDGAFKEMGEMTCVRLKSPHVKGYRADKKACIEDVGLNQVEIQ